MSSDRGLFMKVVNDIHLVDETNANVYVIDLADKLLIVDAGLPGMGDVVLRYIKDNLRRTDEVLIVVTHAHYDHVGSLKVLKEKLNARVACHVDEAPYVRGEKYLGGYRHEPVEPDILLRDEDLLYDRFKVVHVPGHTPGSICLYDIETQALFTGDLVYEKHGELYEIPYQYSLDPMANRRQIIRIAELGFKHVLPSHGKPILDNGLVKWRELVEKLKAT